MKIQLLGEPKVIISNPRGRHCYFGWPDAKRLQNGKIAVSASGFRLAHVDPFGKTVLAFSDDDGETYTPPTPVIDTMLDDRGGGILPYGEKSLIVTSFNNRIEFQRKVAAGLPPQCSALANYSNAYLDTITPEEEEKDLGALYRISHDYGVTFGPILKSPVYSPHGPVLLKDGSILWLGEVYANVLGEANLIQVHKLNPDGTFEYLSDLPPIYENGKRLHYHEPHAIETDDGRIVCLIRIEGSPTMYFTLFQTESCDGGKTWSAPRQLLPSLGGSPAHLMRHSSGVLICSYGTRVNKPYCIRVMFSTDNGNTWETGYDLYQNHFNDDLGYPATVERKDGSLLTVFYARPTENDSDVIMQQNWQFS